MTNQSDLEFLKQSFPNYKVIDITAIKDFNHFCHAISNNRKDLIIVLFRSDDNKQLWSKLDEIYTSEGDERRVIRIPPDIKLFNRDSELSLCLNKCKEDVLKTISLWLKSASQSTTCFICDEVVEVYGYVCLTCIKAPCINCFTKMLDNNDRKCPLCRSGFKMIYDLD